MSFETKRAGELEEGKEAWTLLLSCTVIGLGALSQSGRQEYCFIRFAVLIATAKELIG